MMNTALMCVLAGCALFLTIPATAATDDAATTIIGMEKAALDRWGKGDPGGFLEITAPDVVYFDPFMAKRLDGLEALRKLYESFRGQIHIDHYDLIDPKVTIVGDMALLTFNFVSHGSEGDMKWNTTEVYQRTAAGWRIIHSHWSLTQPKLAPAEK